jgi:phage-related minor tail protein
VGINVEDPILSSQRKICADIVTLQVDEYNRTVGMLDQLDQYGGALQKLSQLANDVNSLGTTSGATTQAATFSAITAHAMQGWQAAIAGDEAIIQALNQQQSVLAKIALRGTNQGNLVQSAAFAAAFK